MALVELQGLYKTYHTGDSVVHALDGVSLSINAGEFVAIVGQSGSGKSTLMNMLGCLDIPDAGSYLLDGADVAHISERTLAKIRNEQIGFIFQGFNLIPSLSALENVELPLTYRGIKSRCRREMAIAALKRVEIGNRMSHLPAQLSGGQQQRVAIARAIAARPPILLADEPTGNLDSLSGVGVMDILHELHSEGRTIILITHDDSIAADAHRIVRIADGIVVSDCPS